MISVGSYACRKEGVAIARKAARSESAGEMEMAISAVSCSGRSSEPDQKAEWISGVAIHGQDVRGLHRGSRCGARTSPYDGAAFIVAGAGQVAGRVWKIGVNCLTD